jgi:L,D-peptidoglycan transpeptidase YkuD (ErfK/YbiS/YcfS/YnhG family)
LPAGSHHWPYRQITEQDAWIDDPLLPHYNHLVTIPSGQEPPWFQRQKIKPLDPAYHWCVLIEHNYPDSIPGAGSAIFFHIERGEKVPTAGCITMTRDNLEKLLRWLDPSANPEFVLLTRADYKRLWQDWKLPPPLQAAEAKP